MSTDKLQDLEVQFKMHETQCEERWKTIFARVEGVENRLDKMHHLILGGGATTILFLLGILSTVIINNWYWKYLTLSPRSVLLLRLHLSWAFLSFKL